MRSRFVRVAVRTLCVAILAVAISAVLGIFWVKERGTESPGAASSVKSYVQMHARMSPEFWQNGEQRDVLEASQRPYEGTNVFVALPSGEIVRQGESIPPLVEEDKKGEDTRKASEEWEQLVKLCSGGARANGRKVGYVEFAKALGRLPREKRGENLKYAINLMDDANFLLIATLALDRTQSDELIALAFDACLNRDCASSRAVIEEISKDKSHPMYVDAARVMDVRRLSGH